MAKMWPSYWPYNIYVYAYNLIRWATFRLQKVEKQRERWKTQARNGKDEREDKTLKRVIFHKTGKLKCWPFFGPLIEVMAIHIHKHIHTCGEGLPFILPFWQMSVRIHTCNPINSYAGGFEQFLLCLPLRVLLTFYFCEMLPKKTAL